MVPDPCCGRPGAGDRGHRRLPGQTLHGPCPHTVGGHRGRQTDLRCGNQVQGVDPDSQERGSEGPRRGGRGSETRPAGHTKAGRADGAPARGHRPPRGDNRAARAQAGPTAGQDGQDPRRSGQAPSEAAGRAAARGQPDGGRGQAASVERGRRRGPPGLGPHHPGSGSRRARGGRPQGPRDRDPGHPALRGRSGRRDHRFLGAAARPTR